MALQDDGNGNDESSSSEPHPKRVRTQAEDAEGGGGGGVVVPYHQDGDGGGPETLTNNQVSSSLSSPTLQLSGHKGSIYALEYSPGDGAILCSTSFDGNAFLWSHGSMYENFNVLSGHKNAILDVCWLDTDTVATCSADKTVMLWDVLTGQRLRKWVGHDGIVNACTTTLGGSSSSSAVVASASDDGTIRLWDRRQKACAAQFPNPTPGSSLGRYPLLAIAGTETQVFAGGLENQILCFDVGTRKPLYAMTGHTGTITSLAASPVDSKIGGDATHLLSNSMDGTLRMWDIRPFVGNTTTYNNNAAPSLETTQAQPAKRQVKQFVGHKHHADRGLLKCAWSSAAASSAGDAASTGLVTCGSADGMVHIFDVWSSEELYLLPGHKGCLNAVAFHPVENLVASGASDCQIFVGELS